MSRDLIGLILGEKTPSWDAPVPTDFPRRSLAWYLDRARGFQHDSGERPEAHRPLVGATQRPTDDERRDN